MNTDTSATIERCGRYVVTQQTRGDLKLLYSPMDVRPVPKVGDTNFSLSDTAQ